MAKIGNFILYMTGGIVILAGLLLWGVRLAGLTPYVVQSGSMEPALPVGAVAYVREVTVEELEQGDLLTFRDGENVVTHRIVEKLETDDGTTAFITRGDANSVNDGNPVRPEAILGKVAFSVPYLGYIPVALRQATVMLKGGGRLNKNRSICF